MLEAVAAREQVYSLSETTVLPEPGLSGATSPDALVRQAITPEGESSLVSAICRIVIRTGGLRPSVEVQARGPLPRSFRRSVEKVVDLLALPTGWNSYSARPIAPQNVVTAIRLLAELLDFRTVSPVVVPTVRGGIQLEWHTERGDIEIYIRSPENVTFFAEDLESGESVESPVTGHEHELKRWVERISTR